MEAATARAIGLLGTGGISDAVNVLDGQIGRAPWTSELYLLRGLAKANLNALPEAIADVERARMLTPEPQRAVALLSGLYAAANMPDEAAALRQEVQKLGGK
jgi:tetratricopeptide (TPR) repeat protein